MEEHLGCVDCETNHPQAEVIAVEQLRAAHDRAVRAPIADVALFVQTLLGQKWTAYMAGVADPKAVGKWARGIRKPQPDSERKLRDAYQIALLISMVDDDETARVWFSGMNPVLDHRAPAWVIANLPDGCHPELAEGSPRSSECNEINPSRDRRHNFLQPL